MLHLLVGETKIRTAIPDLVNANEFAEDILGFEEVDEQDLEVIDDFAETAGMNQSYATGGGSYMQAIPEER